MGIQRAIPYGQAVCRCVFKKQLMGQTLSQVAPLRLQPRLALGARPSGSILRRSASVRWSASRLFISGAHAIYEHRRFNCPVSASGERAGRSQRNAINQICKIEISKLRNRQKAKSQKLSSTFFHTRTVAKLLFARSNSCSHDRRPNFRSFVFALHSQCARCIFNGSKQCPNEATTFYLAEQPRSEERI
jgi:hypothetical protein